MHRFMLVVMVLALFCTSGFAQNTSSPSAPSFSAVGQFSTTTNPNGTWSYGYTSTLGGPFNLYAIQGTTFFSNEIGWFGPFPNCCSPGSPLVVVTAAGPPQSLDVLPGDSGQLSVVRWTAPANGPWDIVGQFFGTGATSVDVHVLRNSSSIFDNVVNNSDAQPLGLTLRLKAGDTIDFAVGVGVDGSNSFDSTGFQAVISPHAYTFSTIDFPGATETRAFGVNDHGDVVGWYQDSAGNIHGFLLSKATFTSIDVPGATLTQARGINDAGRIVGLYTDNIGGGEHGFLLSRRSFTPIDFLPGGVHTDALGIDAEGDIVGSYDTGDITTSHGFMLKKGRFTSFDDPVAALTTTGAFGINPRGQIVGVFSDNSGASHGFLLSAGNFTTVDDPLGVSDTSATGINAPGQIAGNYFGSDGVSHGFLLSAGDYITVDVLGGIGTRARGINAAGQIVGFYREFPGGLFHGFLATPGAEGKP